MQDRDLYGLYFFCLDNAIFYDIMKIMNIVILIIISLACWRLTSLLYQEVGPFDMFVNIRKLFGISHYDDGAVSMYPDTMFGKLFACVWCLSMWVSFGLVVSYCVFPVIVTNFCLWLSLSTITIMVEKWLTVAEK